MVWTRYLLVLYPGSRTAMCNIPAMSRVLSRIAGVIFYTPPCLGPGAPVQQLTCALSKSYMEQFMSNGATWCMTQFSSICKTLAIIYEVQIAYWSLAPRYAPFFKGLPVFNIRYLNWIIW